MRRQPARSRRRWSPQAEQADFEAQEHLADMAQCAVAVALLRELISKRAINVCVGPMRQQIFEGKAVTIQDNRDALAANMNGATIDIWLFDPTPEELAP